MTLGCNGRHVAGRSAEARVVACGPPRPAALQCLLVLVRARGSDHHDKWTALGQSSQWSQNSNK
jgi:hypothetical protein